MQISPVTCIPVAIFFFTEVAISIELWVSWLCSLPPAKEEFLVLRHVFCPFEPCLLTRSNGVRQLDEKKLINVYQHPDYILTRNDSVPWGRLFACGQYLLP
jgi:hypothetical protein